MTLTKDMAADLAPGISIQPQALTDGTEEGASVDLQGYEGGAALLDVGLWTDGTHTCTVQDSADDSTFADLAAADVSEVKTTLAITPAHPIVIDANTEDGAVYTVGFAATVRRYVRWEIVTASSTTGMVVGGFIVRGFARHL